MVSDRRKTHIYLHGVKGHGERSSRVVGVVEETAGLDVEGSLFLFCCGVWMRNQSTFGVLFIPNEKAD